VDRTLLTPIHRQIYASIRAFILDRRIPPRAKLPASRDLAKHLGVGRNTVVAAYDQLQAEGLVEARPGSITRVAELLSRTDERKPVRAGACFRSLSRRGALIASIAQPQRTPGIIQLYPGVPDTSSFPISTWARLLARNARKLDESVVGIHDFAGHPRFQEAIANYLGGARGVDCAPEQVIAVTGAQAALDLAARILIDDGDWAWMEEPGYRGARSALLGGGARLAPLRVSRRGWSLDDVTAPPPRIIYVTPSCQWPYGCVMQMDERLRLLALAERHNAWILEDDYDGEYRFRGQPAPALRGFDGADRVIYIGTFGKTLFPSLRLGFLVAPLDLAPAFGRALSVSGQFAPPLIQVTVADFIREGYFASHLKRMRRLYSARQVAFVELCRDLLGRWLRVEENDSGMQVLARFIEPSDDCEFAAAALRNGVDVQPVSIDYHCDTPESGLLLGFAALSTSQAEKAVRALRKTFLEFETQRQR
jgi:GntR family transcriptional regulator/MocR family aminotransferase